MATSHALAQSDKSGNVKTTIAKVNNFGGNDVIPYAGASLARNNNGVFATISTSGLTPGNVVPLWWAVFNNPEHCAVPGCVASDLDKPAINGSAQYGGGYVVALNGRADFSGYLDEGDNATRKIDQKIPKVKVPRIPF